MSFSVLGRVVGAVLIPMALAPLPVHAGEPPDLRGTWRLDLILVTKVQVPVLGTTTGVSHTSFLSEIGGTAEVPVARNHTCAIDVRTSSLFSRSEIPAAMIAGIPPRTVSLAVTADGEGWRLRADLSPQYIGYDPARAGGSVPQAADDPAITDHEGDGHPGATIRVHVPALGWSDIYMAQRIHTVLEGRSTAPDRVEGQAVVQAFEQRTLGASRPMFDVRTEVRIDPRSSFRMVRIEDGATCSTILGGAGSGPVPPPSSFRRLRR